MTRNAGDCYPTPPDACIVVRDFLDEHYPSQLRRETWGDQSAGFGTLLPWLGVGRPRRYAIELSPARAHHEELRRHIPEEQLQLGVDALAAPSWDGDNLADNPPFSNLQAFVERAIVEHERRRRRSIACLLTPVGFWHAQRRGHLPPPQWKLELGWRPNFAAGFRPGGVEASGPSQDYVWAIYAPRFAWSSRYTDALRVEQPTVPTDLIREHARLARIAARLG